MLPEFIQVHLKFSAFGKKVFDFPPLALPCHEGNRGGIALLTLNP